MNEATSVSSTTIAMDLFQVIDFFFTSEVIFRGFLTTPDTFPATMVS